MDVGGDDDETQKDENRTEKELGCAIHCGSPFPLCLRSRASPANRTKKPRKSAHKPIV